MWTGWSPGTRARVRKKGQPARDLDKVAPSHCGVGWAREGWDSRTGAFGRRGRRMGDRGARWAALGALNAALRRQPASTGDQGSLGCDLDILLRPSSCSPTPQASPGTLVSTETTAGCRSEG